MRSNELNRKVKLTPKESEEIINDLIKAGLDRKELGKIFGGNFEEGCTKASNCEHPHECDKFFMVNGDTLGKIKEAIQRRKIDPKALGAASSKILK